MIIFDVIDVGACRERCEKENIETKALSVPKSVNRRLRYFARFKLPQGQELGPRTQNRLWRKQDFIVLCGTWARRWGPKANFLGA